MKSPHDDDAAEAIAELRHLIAECKAMQRVLEQALRVCDVATQERARLELASSDLQPLAPAGSRLGKPRRHLAPLLGDPQSRQVQLAGYEPANLGSGDQHVPEDDTGDVSRNAQGMKKAPACPGL
jgi:hypothetical protein